MATNPIPIFDPQGTIRMIPPEHVADALAAKGKLAVHMIDPQGTARWIPEDQKDAALAAKATLAPDAEQPWYKPETDLHTSRPGDQHFTNPLVEGASQFTQSVGAAALEPLAYVGQVAHRHLGSIIGNSGPISDALTKASEMKRDSISAKAGQVFETMAEFMVGEGELKALTKAEKMQKLAPVVKMLERYPKISEAILAHPEVAKHLPDAVRQGIVGAIQTKAHGGTLAESLESGAEAGSLGLAVPMLTGALRSIPAALAEKVAPTVREMDGVKFTQLASEMKGPSGESIATPAAEKAAQLSTEPAIRTERQEAFKQLHTNLAQKGVENALTQTNEAVGASGVSPNVKATSLGGDWRYVPPDGSTAMTGEQARSAMNELKAQWLEKDWPPAQEAKFQQAYDDLRNQVDRHDSYTASQGVKLHDPAEAAKGITSYKDAADLLDRTSKAKFSHIADLRERYSELTTAREQAQDDYFRAWNKGGDAPEALKNVNDADKAIEKFFQSDDVAGKLAPGIAKRAQEEARLSSAFRRLHNVIDGHFNLKEDTAEQIDRPRVATKLNSLAKNIEGVKTDYGDVLNPVLGDQGLNHIIELGDLLKTKVGKDAPKTVIGHAADAFRQHMLGGARSRMGLAATAPAMWLLHTVGHMVGGTAAGAGILGVEGAYRAVRNRMATDPEFATKVIQAAKTNKNPKAVGQLIASMMMVENRDQSKEAASAPSK